MSQDDHASKMEVVDSRESRDIRGRERFPSTRTRSWGAREEKKIQEGRGGEGAKLIRGGESSAREERKREDERASSISPTW